MYLLNERFILINMQVTSSSNVLPCSSMK
jgi:hypothetical protein